MELNIESPHLELTKDIHAYIHTHYNRLKKVYSRITGCDVVLRQVKDGERKSCEVEARLLIPKSSFFARDKAESFEIAIKNIMENLLRQLRHEKEGRQETW